MENQIADLQDFLNRAHSVYHAVAALENKLKDNGYTRLLEADSWELVPGGRYYLTRNGSALQTIADQIDMFCALVEE